MHRPVFGASTVKDQTVYRIDYDTTEEDGDEVTMRMPARSPAASSVVPAPPPSRRERHSLAETLPLSSRR